MTSALLASNVLLWILVAVLSLVVLALVRQIGLLHERIRPAGALFGDERPAVGERAPVYELRDWSGRVRRIGGIEDDARRTLLLFVSPTCPVCKELLPVVDSLARAEGGEPGLRVVLASDGPREEHEAFVERHDLADRGYVLSSELGRGYQVGRLPHAVLLDGEGFVRARGLVNSREHLESLLEAHARGVASLQEYARGSVHPIRRTG